MDDRNTFTDTEIERQRRSLTASPEGPWVTRLFPDRESAERAYQALRERGYDIRDVDLVMSDETRRAHFSLDGQTEMGTKAAKGASVGGAIGGTAGAIAAIVAAVGSSIAIPGLGLIVAGPVATALAGAGAGAAAGGLLGALIGAGIPEERVKQYEQALKKGGILIGVRPRSEEDARYLEGEWANAVDTQTHR